MSFAHEHGSDPVFSAIATSCTRFGFTARRADQVIESGLIDAAVNQLLDESRVVIADLTEARPNVYHEVGYALGSHREIILVARSGTTIDWPLAHRRIEFWNSLVELDAALEARLSALTYALLEGRPDGRLVLAGADGSRPVAAATFEQIVAQLGIQPLSPYDDDRTLGELDPGFIGYTQYWILWRAIEKSRLPRDGDYRSLPRCDLADVRIRSRPFGSAETMIVVTPANEVMFVFAIRPTDATRMGEVPHGRSISLTVRTQSDAAFCAFALVSGQRIRGWRPRHTPVGNLMDLIVEF